MRCSRRCSSAFSPSFSLSPNEASTRRKSCATSARASAPLHASCRSWRAAASCRSRIGNQKHYRADTDAPIFEELRGLVEKTVGLAEPIKQCFAPCAETIRAAFICGSVAKRTDTAQSDIDLMIIGDDLNYSDLYTAAQRAESALRRRVNPLFLSPKDWQRKASDTGSVIGKVTSAPKAFIIGSEKEPASWGNKSSTIS